MADRFGRLGLSTKEINFPVSVFDSSWEGNLYNYIVSYSKDIGYTNILHNITLDPECKYERPLIFDIVLEYSNSTKVVIEIQGPTHFKETYKSKPLETVLKRDEIKYQYCLDNNIDLYYFTYDQNLLDKYGYPHYVYTSEDLLLERLKSYSSPSS